MKARRVNTTPRLSHLTILGLALLAIAATVPAWAGRVVDDFESGLNPNEWGWANVFGDAAINPQGGNPGAWVDTGAPYFAVHPYFISEPPAGSPLQVALASGSLQTAAIDLQRLDTTDISGCLPTHLQASFVSLALFDLHSADVMIEAHTTDGPAFPFGAFPWLTASFDIPSGALDTPSGWELAVPDGLDYTWSDLMQNIDGIRFFVGNPDQSAFSACSHLGADNAIVMYGGDDSIFANGFDGE